MPYRNAHFVVLALLALTFVAFWPSYFSQLPSGKSAWHYHAAGAMLWTLMVIVQSWSIHGGHRTLHRNAGLASFLLFPLFLVGGMMAIQAETVPLTEGFGKPENINVGPFGFFDPLANIGFAVLFYGGLKHRRNVQLHSRYMIATLLFLVAPVIWRLLGTHSAFFNSSTPETLYRFSYAMVAGNAGAIALTWYLYRLAPKHGRPFLIVAGFIVAQQVLFETAGRLPAWERIFAELANVNSPLLLTATGIVSLAVSWLGWEVGKTVATPNPAASG
jgi:uncharacterized membrane protein YozB (DUF420 family)